MKTIDLPIIRNRADWGASGHDGTSVAYRTVAVEADGSVLAWDHVGQHYTRHHDLTDGEQAEARRLAGLRGGDRP